MNHEENELIFPEKTCSPEAPCDRVSEQFVRVTPLFPERQESREEVVKMIGCLWCGYKILD